MVVYGYIWLYMVISWMNWWVVSCVMSQPIWWVEAANQFGSYPGGCGCSRSTGIPMATIRYLSKRYFDNANQDFSENQRISVNKGQHSELVGGLEPWNFMTFHILGISSSQLTNSFFQRGRAQPTTSEYRAYPEVSSFPRIFMAHLYDNIRWNHRLLQRYPKRYRRDLGPLPICIFPFWFESSSGSYNTIQQWDSCSNSSFWGFEHTFWTTNSGEKPKCWLFQHGLTWFNQRFFLIQTSVYMMLLPPGPAAMKPRRSRVRDLEHQLSRAEARGWDVDVVDVDVLRGGDWRIILDG